MEDEIKGKCKPLADGGKICYLGDAYGRRAVVEVPRDGSRRIISNDGIDREKLNRGVSIALRDTDGYGDETNEGGDGDGMESS